MIKETVRKYCQYVTSCFVAASAFVLFGGMGIFAINGFIQNPALDLPIMLNVSRVLAILAIFAGMVIAGLRFYWLIFISPTRGNNVGFHHWCNELRKKLFER